MDGERWIREKNMWNVIISITFVSISSSSSMWLFVGRLINWRMDKHAHKRERTHLNTQARHRQIWFDNERKYITSLMSRITCTIIALFVKTTADGMKKKYETEQNRITTIHKPFYCYSCSRAISYAAFFWPFTTENECTLYIPSFISTSPSHSAILSFSLYECATIVCRSR